MNYMGSKRQYSKYIIPILNKYIKDNEITCFYDVFTGGGNVADKVDCKRVVGCDLSPTLIALHKQAQDDFSKIPLNGDREYWDRAYTEYKRLRDNNWENPQIPLYEIGAIEWYSSYARGGFPRGYAKITSTRNYFIEGRKAHQTQANTTKYKKIDFVCSDYRNLEIEPNQVIYCDPPYKGTKPYGIEPKFNHAEFFEWAREKSKTNPVFVSEQSAPDDFEIIWAKDGVIRSASLHNDFEACEKLFFIDNRVKV